MRIKHQVAMVVGTALVLLCGSVGLADNGRFGGGNETAPTALLNLPYEELSTYEMESLMHMREEEKLARDVYLALYDLWEMAIFQNIAQSEQQHMDTVLALLNKYGLADSASTVVGVFNNADLQELYNVLLQTGMESLENALQVGAVIEDLDINDLMTALSVVDNTDIQTAYQNLLKGSRNHLRSFFWVLDAYGITYEAQFISQEVLEEIVNSSRESGMVDENGDPAEKGKMNDAGRQHAIMAE